MTGTVKSVIVKNALFGSTGPDSFAWSNPYGGTWGWATEWLDTTTGTVAATAPGAANSVVVSGGSNSFTSIAGTGAAAQLAVNNDVLLWGAVTVGGTVSLGASADLDLDGGASLDAASLALANAASLEVGGGSSLTIAAAATLAAGFLAALDGSTVQLGGLIANSVNLGYALAGNTIAVDDDSSLEVGSAGGAALGAVTIDSGVTAAVSGTINGNLVLNGVLGIQANGALAIDVGDPFGSAQSIGGSGTLMLSENSVLTLGVADSASIAFGGPNGTLAVDVLPTGAIRGFTAGDAIELVSAGTAVATGLRYAQTSANTATLTLVKGGRAVGALTLAGNYFGSVFHLGFDSQGDGFITLQTIGSAPVQPSVITGTVGYDVLSATANGQTLTGLGGSDTLGAGAFTGIAFKDTSAGLNGDTITSFSVSDAIDLTDMNAAAASLNFVTATPASGTLTVSDGAHTATIGIAFGSGLPVGYFVAGSDGGSGTDLRYFAPNTDAFVFGPAQGGRYSVAANWQDTTIGSTATVAPSYSNAVTIAGGSSFADFTGNGFAASLIASGDVLLWGTIVAGSRFSGVSGALTQTGTLALDGAADLMLAGTASVGGLIEVGGGSTLTAAGLFFASPGASLLAIGASTARFATLLGIGGSVGGTLYAAAAIGIDATSSIEIGAAGGAVAGALTIDSGATADLAGTVNGNVVVNGTLVTAGTLAIAPFGSGAGSVGGAGTLELTYGTALSLGGPDSAAILFSPTSAGSYSTTTETLALGTIMPAATISGFTAGDAITVALTVTNLVWSNGRLTLRNGTATVGTLVLSGVHVSSQFQVQPSAGGLSSVITYAATPGTAGGNSVTGSSDNYTWNAAAGGVWANAGVWTDTTTGTTPTAAPGPTNAVVISDITGAWTHQIIYGPAAAASLSVTSTSDTVLIGSFFIGGQLSVSGYGAVAGDVALYGGSNVSAGSLNVASLFRVTGASLLTVFGLATGTFISGNMTVSNGSVVRVQGGAAAITGTVAVDATSSVEFGTANTATAGMLLIDYGQAPTLQGVAAIAANVIVNGGLMAYSASIGGFGGAVGSIGGTGTITIGALGSSGYLVLDAADTAAIAFQPYSANGVPYAFESLELQGPVRTGTISGFIGGDSIIIDQAVTRVTFSQTAASQGTLTLANGSATVGTLTLAGNYAGQMFQLDMAPQTGVGTITVQAATNAARTAAASTGQDAYAWAGASGSSRDIAANWFDTTTGTVPVTMPGSATAVTIAGNVGAGQYTTIGGTGATGGMTVTGNVLLTGRNNVTGVVHISNSASPPAALALEGGASLIASGSVRVFGRFEIGAGSSATMTGYTLLAGGSLLALDGSTVQAGGIIASGSGNVIVVDATSAVQIGTSASAGAAGALTVAAGAPVEIAGLIYGSVVNNGTVWLAGGSTLLIDMTATAANDPFGVNPAISGSGVIMLTEGSTLGLGGADSAAVQFAGPNATLLLAGPVPTAAISGFASGDQVELEQTVTGAAYAQVNATLATVTLTNGAGTVGVLKFSGSFAGGNTAFHLDSAADGSSATITLQSLLIAPVQPTLIYGTIGSDYLVATANGQTISGYGGSDILSGGGFSSTTFKDLSTSLRGSTIQGFVASDTLDFTDVTPGSAAVTYAGGTLAVTDGVHAASLSLAFATNPTSGAFHVSGDGAGGTLLTWS